MGSDKPGWKWGFFYFNREDSRLLVPLPSRLGLAVNFGHPRATHLIGWICGGALLAMIAAPIAAHPSWSLRDPTDLIWFVVGSMAAVGLVRLNGWFAWSDYRLISLASFGVLAAGFGFSIQRLINGPLAFWWGSHLTWRHYLVLAPVAAASQTFGKWAALLLLLKARPAASRRDFIRYGLLVGLGFTVWEIGMVYVAVAWAQVSVAYLSVWERVSASMFHVYSGGLIALALQSGRWRLIALVVGVHAWMDYLACTGESVFGITSVYGIESIFSICAIFIWGCFLLAARKAERSLRAERGNEASGPRTPSGR